MRSFIEIIEIEIKAPSFSDSIPINNLSISYSSSLSGQKIDLKSIFHQKAKNIFILDYSTLANGLYGIILNSSNYKQENFIGFIKNEKTATRGIIKKTLYVQKINNEVSNQTEPSWSGFSVDQVPYLKVNSERIEWDCYVRKNFKKELLDSLENQKIAFDIEWDNNGNVVNVLFSNTLKNENLKKEFEAILFASPAWIRPKEDNFYKDTYSFVFDNSRIYNCK